MLSDDKIRSTMFPYAKIECARFKGTGVGTFIDQKTIDEQVGLQAELAYQFVLRHINKGAEFEGVYRNDIWEYPVIAIREVIRNAVIHRDYTLSGKDIKVAVFDDRIEITSPGLLPPSIDYNDMKSKQSDVRNKTLAPVFKKIGIIEQWGNGLSIIADEMELYPEISLKWEIPGLSFRVIFIKTNYSTQKGTQKTTQKTTQKIINLIVDNKYTTTIEMAELLNRSRSAIAKQIAKMKEEGVIKRIGPDKGGYWEILKK